MAEQWRDFPLPDGSYSDDTRPWSQQDVLGYLPTLAEQEGAQSRVKYRTVPGLSRFADVGEGPHRGARDVEGRRFVVSGRYLYLVASNGQSTQLGVIPGTGRVSMTHNQIANGNELVIATGDNSYIYNTVTDELSATGVPLVCVDFLNQRILGVDQARRFWRYSGLADGSSWDPLDNESAESSPDRIVGGIVSNGEWYVFGERTIEVFSNSPTDFTAFQRTQVIEKGCASAWTIQRLAGEIFFVGDDSVVYRLSGYSPVPVSPKPITATIASSKPARLFAFTWEDAGYVVYYLTAKDGHTFGFDVTSQRWHRRESFGLNRWRVATMFKSNGAWYAGDAFNGTLYRMDWRTVYEGCEIMPRGMRTGVLHSAGNRVTVHGLRLSVATGQDAQGVTRVEGPTITGSAPDGIVNEPYTFSYTMTPGDAPIAGATINESDLLAGLEWDEATATISGTPTETGSMTLTVRVTDTNGLWGDLDDEIEVSEATLPSMVGRTSNSVRFLKIGADGSTTIEQELADSVFTSAGFSLPGMFQSSGDGGVVASFPLSSPGKTMLKNDTGGYSIDVPMDVPITLQVQCAKASPDGAYVAFGFDDAYSDHAFSVYRRDLSQYTLVATLLEGGRATPFSVWNGQFNKTVEWSPDGNYLACVQGVFSGAIFKRTGDTFTQLSGVDVPVADNVAWANSGEYFSVSTSADFGGGALNIFSISGDSVSLVATGGTANDCQGDHVWLDGDSAILSLGQEQGEYATDKLRLYSFDGSTLTTLAAPTQPTSDNPQGISRVGQHVAIFGGADSSYSTEIFKFDSGALTPLAVVTESYGTLIGSR